MASLTIKLRAHRAWWVNPFIKLVCLAAYIGVPVSVPKMAQVILRGTRMEVAECKQAN